MPDVAEIAGRLSEGAKAATVAGAGCDNHTELVAAGIWEPEPGVGHPYYIYTPFGEAVRAYLENSRER